jgi:hypothetical protein
MGTLLRCLVTVPFGVTGAEPSPVGPRRPLLRKKLQLLVSTSARGFGRRL